MPSSIRESDTESEGASVAPRPSPPLGEARAKPARESGPAEGTRAEPALDRDRPVAPALVVRRRVDACLSFPYLVLILSVMAVLGPGLLNLVVALAILIAAINSRVIRGAAIAVAQSTYVEAARALGCGHARIIARHILPNVMATIIILATIGLGATILAESSLSFLGFGVPPPFPSWGAMLSGSGRTYMFRAPWMAVWPGVAISLAVFGFNMLGDALRDVLDPRLRGGAR